MSSNNSLLGRSIVLWFVASTPLLLARSEPCLLCSQGQDTPLLDKQINIDWPISVESCAELDLYANALESAESDECDKVQSIGTLCGCPQETSSCSFCPENSTVTMPGKKLAFLAPQFDGVAPSCELFEAHVHSVRQNDTRCNESIAFRSACGCPVREDPCDFCEGDDLETPDRLVPAFQKGYDEYWQWDVDATCGLLQALWRNFPSASEECQSIQQYGYFCGCNESELRRRFRVIVWMPRVSAILSILGSLFIIYDILKRSSKTTQHQLLLCLSCIDCISSVAWALSSLPVPPYDEDGYYSFVYGASGTEATCTAQAFFIQLGMTSPMYNMALAVYYSMVILGQWDDERIARFRWCLLGVPLLCGLALACAAIPFYGSTGIVMCYVIEHEVWFLVLPISTAIFFATLLMFLIFLKVYRQERRVQRYRMNHAHDMSRRVFWQGFWYLMCFYVSWPVVIAWVYIDETLYHRYAFLCCALFLAPLQGFLNFLSYSHLRLLKFCRVCCSSWNTKRESAPSSTSRLVNGLHHSSGENNEATSSAGVSVDAALSRHVKETDVIAKTNEISQSQQSMVPQDSQ